MSPDDADLDDVLVPTEEAHPDHREHAKASSHPDDDELARRTEHERDVVGADRETDR
ncbi:hypothetical protein [Mycolicibacterium psychrotolerans]|uniref:Uncharacterized protein n=1 Tax=Mycolicibacterium psychrotolerans TaxID=216929 RepID=A0A7I7M5W1_9MYCO|nr:hypothetical protein [Mycolicibacterium psychrotolerans]BBX67591.1 hypothetical protein MPSYJ_10520 [Mycolicibacterium psychrotolerans]